MKKIINFLKIHQKAFIYSFCGCVFLYLYHDNLNKLMISVISMMVNITLSPKLIDGVVGIFIKILENIVDTLIGLGIITAFFGHSFLKKNKKNNAQDNEK